MANDRAVKRDDLIYWQPVPRLGISRFALGTAQLGTDYGIANKAGMPSEGKAKEIILIAAKLGINCFHTAYTYGEGRAESILHEAAQQEPGIRYRIWRGGNDIRHYLSGDGSIIHEGKSLYDSKDIEHGLSDSSVTFIQFPFNPFDQRALKYGWFDKAKERNKLVFVRSIFLQGLLLMDNPPAWARPYTDKWHEHCNNVGIAPLDACLWWTMEKTQDYPVSIIFGAELPEQVQQIMSSATLACDTTEFDVPNFNVPKEVRDPRLWPEK